MEDLAIANETQKISCVQDIHAGLKYLANKDAKLATAISELQAADIEVPLRLREPGFAGLAEIIISQQVSKASGNAISARFHQYISPSAPQKYLQATQETRIAIGLSRPKQRTFDALSEAMLEKTLVLEELDKLPASVAIENMCQVKGVGPWTAEVFLLFCIGHADIFPAGDLALQEAVRVLYNKRTRPNDKQLRKIANRWAPWRGVAARLLWAYYGLIKGGREVAP